MSKDILVSLIGDDVFAQNWMSLLLVRDWRTRVVGEFSSKDDLSVIKQYDFQKSDFYIIDLDSTPEVPGLLMELLSQDQSSNGMRVLLVSTTLDSRVIRKIPTQLFAGYLLKNEILSSLAWAITFAAEGSTVFTPATLEFLYELNYPVSDNKIILKSRNVPGLTDHQSDIAKLAIVYSIGRRDLADELKISDQWSYGMVSELYTKLGLSDIFDGSIDDFRYMENDEVIRNHIIEIVQELGTSKKARDVETLAFHLITMPSIEY